MKLAKVKVHSKKRLGRGYGSGKGGHTASRGQKGQKARRHIGILFEGLKMKKSLIKRLPFRRGKDKFKAKDKPMIVNLGALALMPAGSEVSVKSLVDAGIVEKNDASKYGVKILGDGESPKNLTIMLPISKSAAEKVLAAGGKIGLEESTDK